MNIAQYATGLQHVGIPTGDMDGSIRFYTGLGFENIHETLNGASRVVFLQLKDLIVEIWEGPSTGRSGAIDHIAINVTDVEAVYRTVTGSPGTPIIGALCYNDNRDGAEECLSCFHRLLVADRMNRHRQSDERSDPSPRALKGERITRRFRSTKTGFAEEGIRPSLVDEIRARGADVASRSR